MSKFTSTSVCKCYADEKLGTMQLWVAVWTADLNYLSDLNDHLQDKIGNDVVQNILAPISSLHLYTGDSPGLGVARLTLAT